MRTFTINKDPYDEGFNIYKKDKITIRPGVTILVGCNGSGKTTLIQRMKKKLRQDKTLYISFDNLTDGGTNSRAEAGFLGDLDFLATSLCSSEGEEIQMNLGRFAGKIGKLQTNNPEAKELWVFLDSVDSGLSIDSLDELKNLFSLILENSGDTEIYIVTAANSYELARNEACFDVCQCKYVNFESYEDYRNFILNSRATKDKRQS